MMNIVRIQTPSYKGNTLMHSHDTELLSSDVKSFEWLRRGWARNQQKNNHKIFRRWRWNEEAYIFHKDNKMRYYTHIQYIISSYTSTHTLALKNPRLYFAVDLYIVSQSITSLNRPYICRWGEDFLYCRVRYFFSYTMDFFCILMLLLLLFYVLHLLFTFCSSIICIIYWIGKYCVLFIKWSQND